MGGLRRKDILHGYLEPYYGGFYEGREGTTREPEGAREQGEYWVKYLP